MIKIAITGTIASGKSLVEELFQQEEAVALDTDKVTHALLANNPQVIAQVKEIFGTTDRKTLGGIVFSDKQKLKQLEAIIHPEVKRVVTEFFEQNKEQKLVVVSVPLLYEAGMETMFDFVVMVTADEKIRLERLIKTRNLTEEEALKRINARDLPLKGDFIIENNETVANLELKVKNIFRQIREQTNDFSNR